jgi:hypothetical protein
LNSKEAHVFKEEGGGILIISEVFKNREDALYGFGKLISAPVWLMRSQA